MRITQGTTIPYEYQLKDGEGTPLDLTLAVGVTMSGVKDGATSPDISGSCNFITKNIGLISYPWASGETDDIGMYKIEFVITWPGSVIEKVPSNGEEWLLILAANPEAEVP